MGSGCGQGWRGCAGRGSSRRLGRSGQQRGGGLAGAHWSMLNGGADEADRERQQVKDAPLLGGGGCRRGRLGGRYQPYCQQSRIFQKSCPQAQGKNTPTQDPKTEGLRPQGDHSNVKNIFKPSEIPLPPIFVYFLICLSQRVL